MLKFVLVVVLFAAAVYAVMWSIERRRAAGSGGAGQEQTPRRNPLRPPARPQTRQVAPDDDEDFLRWLDRKRKNGQND